METQRHSRFRQHNHHHQQDFEQQQPGADYPPRPALPQAPPTSRLCVKNIPKYLTDLQRLKDHFAAKGQVTDVKILKTRDGQPRQMAFVGYRTVEDAAAALKYFNNTFIDTSRLSIEFARRYRAAAEPAPAAAAAAAAGADGPAAAAAGGDGALAASAHRPWSKYSVGSSKHQQLLAKQQAAAAAQQDAAGPLAADKAAKQARKDKKKARKVAAKQEEEAAAAADPKLAEFLQLMQPRAKAKIWSNDEVLPGQASKAAAARAAAAAGAPGVSPADDDDDLYEDLTPAAAAAAAGGTMRANGTLTFAAAADADADDDESMSLDDGSDSTDSSGSEEADALTAKDAVVVDEGVSDLEYLRARMRKGSTAAAAAGAGDSGGGGSGDDDDDDDSSSSSSSEESEGGVDDEAEYEERRQRHSLASTSTSGSESDGSGSEGDVMHWRQQQQQQQAARTKQPKQQQQQQPQQLIEGDSTPGSTSSDSGSDDDDTKQQQGASGSDPSSGGSDDDDDDFGDGDDDDQPADDPMAVDEGQLQQGQPHSHAGAAGAEAAAAEAAVRESGRLFVRNLAYTAGQLELSELFGAYGDLEEVHLVLDRDTRRSKGIALVKFLLPEDAVSAFRALDMTPFQGRLLHVLPAKHKPGQDTEGKAAEQGPGGYKADKEAQQKRDAGNRSAWSTLFMRSDTVAAAVAAHYGVSKAQLLDAAAEDLPLRMALGEAQVIAQTKAALADAGINTKALEAAASASGSAAAHKSVARSSTSLLVKNLPYSADTDELQQLFVGPTGRTLVRMVLPPTKTLAVVEFGEPQDARAAFKALAYKKYQQVPLYLEWAPRDIWDSPPPPAPAAGASAAAAASLANGGTPSAAAGAAGAAGGLASGSGAAAAAVAKAGAAGDVDDNDEEEQAPVVSIYVKNLNFATTDAALKSHFDKTISAGGGQIHSAKVARRKGTDGKLLSMGYGFVEVDSEAVAQAVIKQLQGSMLDKHKLTLQLSKRSSTAANASSSSKAAAKKAAKDAAADGSKGAKLVVRNVAFEATKKDIMGLFGPFGHIKSCRLPKKFDGNHRGFAFLEFTTKQEAANALEGVGGTHLYGRRLVVEYAQAEAEGGLTATGEQMDLQQARSKTAAKFFRAEGRAGAVGEEDAAADAPARKRMKRNL